MAGRVVSYIFRGEISGLQASLRAAGASVGKLGDDLTKADKKSAQFRQGLSTVGDSAGKMGLLAAAGIGLVAKAALDWESAWAGVTKTVDGSAAEMAKLEGELRGLAKTLPATHQEIAAVAEAAGQLGVAREDIASFTETMISLGETTNLSADEAATAIAQMANVMGTAPDEIDNLGSALVALGNDGASTERQIILMAQSISGAGAQIGLAEADILAIANAAASMGIEVEAGGTAISRVFVDMAKATAQGGDMLEHFATTANVSAAQFTQAFRDNPAQAFQMFTEGLNRINKSGGDVFTTLDNLKLSDVRVSRALLGMAASGDLLADSLALGSRAWEENTALALEAAKRYDTGSSKIQVSFNNIKDAAIDFGDEALPAIAAGADKIAGFAQAIGGLPAPVKAVGVSLAGVTAILGGSLWFGSKVLNGVSDVRHGLEQMGLSAEKSKKAMKGLAAAAGGLIALDMAFLAIDKLNQALDESLPGMENLTRRMIDLANAAPGISTSLGAEFDSLSESVSRVADGRWDDGLMSFFDAILPGEQVARSLREASAEIKLIDDGLVNLVNSGAPETAADFLDNLTASMDPATAKQFREELVGYSEALVGVENDAKLAAEGSEVAADGMTAVGDAATEGAEAVDGFVDALEGFNAAISQRGDLRSYREALRDFNKTMEEAPANMKRGSAAWDEVEGKLDNIASTALSVAEDLEGVGRKRFLANARKEFIAAAREMGIPKKAAQDLATELGLLDQKDPRINVTATGIEETKRGVWDLTTAINNMPSSHSITFRYLTTGQIPAHGSTTVVRAEGGPVYGPGTATSDSIPALLSNGEYVIKAAAVDKYGIDTFHKLNAMRLASGGPVGMATGGSVDDRLDILRIQQQINDLRRDLAKDGKDSLRGIARSIAALELRSAQADLRAARRAPIRAGREQMGALRSIELDVEGGASVAETREALREFRADVRETGGVWTKQMSNTAHRLIDLAKATNRTERSLEKETEQRDRLADKLDDEIRALEQLRDTMAAYSQSVAGNFLNDPFNGAYSMKAAGGSAAAPVDDAALAAARAALSDAEGRLAGIRGSSMDPLQRSYLASKAVAEVAECRSQVEQLDRGTKALGEMGDEAEMMVSGLDAMREALVRDAEAAREFAASLATLSANGLNAGLFQQLAASGDVATAGQLAGLGAGGLAEINALWEQREQAAAQVATYATQQVFGAQLDAATRAVTAAEAAFQKSDREIARLNRITERHAARLENLTERGNNAIVDQVKELGKDIRGQARQLQELQRAGKKGRN